jgi:hypothetical protein
MPFIAVQDLYTLPIDKPTVIEFGDSSEGYDWDIPPGSTAKAPPGMHLHLTRGFLAGAPTISGHYSFYVRERNRTSGVAVQHLINIEVTTGSAAVDQEVIGGLITQFFSFGKVNESQKVWFTSEFDSEGRKVFSVMMDDSGQPRNVASITVA